MQRSILLFIALATLSLAQPTTTPADLTPATARKAAPDFSLEDSTGSLIKLSSYKGRVVLLDFWATWCTGCKQEIPWYMEFQDKYKRSGLSAIGVSMDDDGWKSVKPFLQEHKINYPIVIGNWDIMGKSFGFDSMPATLLIDRQGKIADLHVGMVDKAAFEREIQTLLNEHAQTGASYRQLPGATPSYEYQVAFIEPDTFAPNTTNLMFTPNGLKASNVTLDTLIREAYGIEDNQISNSEQQTSALAVKQLYASHYFETALDLTVCVKDPERPGIYLITMKGSQQAGLTGFKGGIVRKVAVDKTRSSLERALAAIKQKLESQKD